MGCTPSKKDRQPSTENVNQSNGVEPLAPPKKQKSNAAAPKAVEAPVGDQCNSIEDQEQKNNAKGSVKKKDAAVIIEDKPTSGEGDERERDCDNSSRGKKTDSKADIAVDSTKVEAENDSEEKVNVSDEARPPIDRSESDMAADKSAESGKEVTGASANRPADIEYESNNQSVDIQAAQLVTHDNLIIGGGESTEKEDSGEKEENEVTEDKNEDRNINVQSAEKEEGVTVNLDESDMDTSLATGKYNMFLFMAGISPIGTYCGLGNYRANV